jgi:hypothetical protein
MIGSDNTAGSLHSYRPDLIIIAGSAMLSLKRIGIRMPNDLALANIAVSEPPCDAADADHYNHLVSQETLKLALGQPNLNLTRAPVNHQDRDRRQPSTRRLHPAT